MSKSTVTRLLIGGAIAVIAGVTLAVAAVWIAGPDGTSDGGRSAHVAARATAA